MGRFIKQHIWSGKLSIYGEGVKSAFKSIGTKVLAKKSKKNIDKTLMARAAAALKEQKGKKAGDKNNLGITIKCRFEDLKTTKDMKIFTFNL